MAVDARFADFTDRKSWAKVWARYRGIFVECGVWQGDFTREVVVGTGFREVYGIDPYRNFDEKEFKDAMNTFAPSHFEEVCASVVAMFGLLEKSTGKAVKLKRGTSLEMVGVFGDGSVDVAYIDANHGYSHVLSDLEAWWPKIADGGMLTGTDCHDRLDKPYDENGNQYIEWGPGCWGYYGVNKALLDFSTKHRLAVQRLPEGHWAIVRNVDCIMVTAFLDLGRSSWAHWTRSTELYVERFASLLRMDVPLVCFIDETVVEKVTKLAAGRVSPTVIISINRDWLAKNVKAWSYLAEEKMLMEGKAYANNVAQIPEHLYPEYNCINHAKIDFVNYAMDHVREIRSDWYGWVDFGYVRDTHSLTPSLTFRPTMFKSDARHVHSLTTGPTKAEDSDPWFTFKNRTVVFTGPFWFGSAAILKHYRMCYHESLQAMHKLGIADQDQAVMLRVSFRHPGLLRAWPIPTNPAGWFCAFTLAHDTAKP
jgi:hypothetical protein